MLYITYMFCSLLWPSSEYLHKNTDKTQQTATLLKFQAISAVSFQQGVQQLHAT